MERGMAPIANMRVPQHGKGAVPVLRHGSLRGVWQVAGGSAGDQIVPSLPRKVSRGLPHIGRVGVRKMGTENPCHICVIIVQFSADGFRVDVFKVVIRSAIRSEGQIKISGAHAQWEQPGAHNAIGAGEFVGGQNRAGLGAVPVHDFKPADKLACTLVEENMRSVHHSGGVQGRRFIPRIRRDNKP